MKSRFLFVVGWLVMTFLVWLALAGPFVVQGWLDPRWR